MEALGRGQPFRRENRPGGPCCRNDATPINLLDIIVPIIDPNESGKYVSMKAGLPGRMSSDEYHGPTEGRTGKATGKTASAYDPPHGDSTVRPVSTARKQPSIAQTQRLLLAALRLWELKNGYRR